MSNNKRAQLLWAAPLLLVGAWLGCGSDLPNTLGDGLRPGAPGDVVGGDDDGDDDPTNDRGGDAFAGSEDNTFDHMPGLGSDDRDPFDVLAQRQEEGPPEIRARLHSCQKPQIAAITNMLRAFGVDLTSSGDPPPAGELLAGGGDALGGANYASRTGEAITWTNSAATKFQDIFVMAAPEIIAALPEAAHCQIDGVGPQMFDGDTCNEDAISCLIGRPARAAHLAICNSLIADAADKQQGKVIAVAALLSAAHTCE